MTATPQRELTSRLETLAASEERGEVTTADAEAIRSFIAAFDPNNSQHTSPDGETTLEPGSLSVYVKNLTEAARRVALVDGTAADVNGVLHSLSNEGRKPWTVHGYSTALRRFYGFHEFGPDADEITRIDTPTGSSFDPDDVLTREELHELLDAADNPRDQAVVALLIYTGMRNNALRTLRVCDVNPDEGTWKVNGEADGLKGVKKYGEKRPLLGSVKPVRDWHSYHPASDDPDAYLITGRPKYGKADPTQPVAGSTIRRIMDRVVESTENPEIQAKPTHPHMMRHNFVTVCKRDYELPDETVKFLIGHSPASKVMETTYSHLSDDDHIERAEVAAGLRDPVEDESPLTPSACNTCGEQLPPAAKACPGCGEVYTPDAVGAPPSLTPENVERLEQLVEELGPLVDTNSDVEDT
jgi:integrase/recombinase XerD